MGNFKLWIETKKSHIKIDMPQIIQTTNYNCGAACLRGIAKYYGVGPDTEDEYIKLCKTTPKDGTTPKNIINAAIKIGLKVEEQHNMTIEELKSILGQKIPVICSLQAWGKEKEYHNDKNGHYIIAIGYDDKYIFFQDPIIKGIRGHVPYKEFLYRWHDTDGKNKFVQYGIIIYDANSYKKRKKDKESKTTKIN